MTDGNERNRFPLTPKHVNFLIGSLLVWDGSGGDSGPWDWVDMGSTGWIRYCTVGNPN